MECACTKMSMRIPNRIVQQVCVWFGVKLGMNSKEILGHMHACFGLTAYSQSSVYGWCKAFRSGRDKLGNLWRPGAPQRAWTRHRIRQVKVLVAENKRITIDHLSNSISISVGSTHRLLHKDLKLKICAKLIPNVLTDHQKRQRILFCQDFLCHCCLHNFQNWVIATDEAWFYVHKPGSKTENKEWVCAEDNRPQVAKPERSCKKMMVIPFFDRCGLLDVQYFENKNVNQCTFEPVLREVWQLVHLRRGHGTWRQRHRLHLHMDNAPAHRGGNVQHTLQEMEWRQIPHPPYSPDLSPCDFFCFLT